eukprot:CAMPEP_0118928240 /NCGR_PEP_ID=MMETSP1169-20130426/5539_1 /TAXON_ID=36882 /ORGANISM="Pyramimonas obovata, Strain CCMP722" /LENGTH=80 /DNA_ID=CAMNT_0006870167 /DNA_START=52 /DNA_END=294 /DNA_ORIENTATION=+
MTSFLEVTKPPPTEVVTIFFFTYCSDSAVVASKPSLRLISRKLSLRSLVSSSWDMSRSSSAVSEAMGAMAAFARYSNCLL